jgi:hypothetical protein
MAHEGLAPELRPDAPAARERTQAEMAEAVHAAIKDRTRSRPKKQPKKTDGAVQHWPKSGANLPTNALLKTLHEQQRAIRCDACQDMGFVTRAVPVGHVDYGRAFPCPTCGGPPDLHERQWRALEQHFGDYWMMGSSKLTAFDIQAFIDLPAHQMTGKQDMVNALWYFSQGEPFTYDNLDLPDPTYGHEPTNSLVLSGPPGLGKTCGAAAAFEALREGEPGLAIEYSGLIASIQDKYSDQEADSGATARMAATVRYLFIDDLGNMGRQRAESDNRKEIMFGILNHRYNFKLPTLITTNLDFDHLAEQFDYKLARRLREWPVWVDVSGAGLDLRRSERT